MTPSAELVTVLEEQQIEARNWIAQNQSVTREIKSQWLESIDTPLIKVITGIRRCGKSYFSLQALKDKRWFYVNFDDERLINLSAKDLNSVYEASLQIQSSIDYWIFDEIQNVEHWDLFINRLQRKGLNIIVTGSNGKLLSREISTHLTGRHLTQEMFPLSFKELLNFRFPDLGFPLITEQRAQVKNLFGEWLKSGGFPELLKPIPKNQYLQELYDRIITRDILQRYQLRNPKGIKQLGALLINTVGQELSYKKAAIHLQIGSMNTVKKYIDYLADAYLFFELECFSHKIRERHSKPRKIYCIDNGMYHSLQTSFSENLGRQLENIVFLHLRRQRKEIFYFRTDHFEVDFLISENRKPRALMGVSASLSDPNTKIRELRSLVLGCKSLGLREATLLTYDEEGQEQHDHIDIKIEPIWKWLIR